MRLASVESGSVSRIDNTQVKHLWNLNRRPRSDLGTMYSLAIASLGMTASKDLTDSRAGEKRVDATTQSYEGIFVARDCPAMETV